MFDDGTPPNIQIRIERVCAGAPHFEAHTDSKGSFSFQLNNNPLAATDVDPEDSSFGTNPGDPRTTSSMSTTSSTGRSSADAYWNCELRAAYPGYRSDVIELASRRSLDDPNVGTIVLHRLVNVKGTTISLTSALAPKNAQKNYEKGVQLAAKGKTEDAEKHFVQATTAYPKYAEAWFALGQVQQQENRFDDARKSYQSAISADSKYVSPYDRLASMSVREGKWQDAATFSQQVIDLNPVEFPGAFWCNAIANFNLKKLDDAQKSATELVKLDTRHHYPDAESMLAEIFLEKKNYDEAAIHLKTYLELAPNAKNADSLKQTLLRIEQARADERK